MPTFVQRVASVANLNEYTVNPNSHWVNLKGSWTTHIVVVILLRLIFGFVPFFSSELGWTMTNLSYCLFQYIMFHGIIGTPFEVNQGAYNNLTLWEQMDNGEQYTPSKKFLTVLPIVIFLMSTHYTNYDVPTFVINFTALVIILIAKLPAFHRVRFFGINMD